MAEWKESKPVIDRANVLMVYTGKQGCMCGCNGKYRYPKANRELGHTQRGYPLNDDEVNEGTVTRVLNQLAQQEDVEVMEIYGRAGDSLFYGWDNDETGHRIALYRPAAENFQREKENSLRPTKKARDVGYPARPEPPCLSAIPVTLVIQLQMRRLPFSENRPGPLCS